MRDIRIFLLSNILLFVFSSHLIANPVQRFTEQPVKSNTDCKLPIQLITKNYRIQLQQLSRQASLWRTKHTMWPDSTSRSRVQFVRSKQ